jgi:hypothetical protein
VVIGSVDFAAAVKRTGESTVLPEFGEQTLTPTVVAVQPEGGGVGVGVGVGVGEALRKNKALLVRPGPTGTSLLVVG